MSQRKAKQTVRYAVVGLGHLAQVAVLPAFKNARNSELAAIISGDAEKRKKLGTKYRLEQVYSYNQYDRALAQVDAVYLVLPNHLHREYAVRAAAAGVHVLCEKPMAVTEEECEAMIEAADSNDVKLMIAYRLHFERANLEAIEQRRINPAKTEHICKQLRTRSTTRSTTLSTTSRPTSGGMKTRSAPAQIVGESGARRLLPKAPQ